MALAIVSTVDYSVLLNSNSDGLYGLVTMHVNSGLVEWNSLLINYILNNIWLELLLFTIIIVSNN